MVTDGGVVPMIRVIVRRIYPERFVEELDDGSKISRSVQAEMIAEDHFAANRSDAGKGRLTERRVRHVSNRERKPGRP